MQKWSRGLLSWMCLIPSIAFAFPGGLNYQGKLVQGTNLFNGTAGIAFRFYAAPGGGTALYTDSNTVSVVDGLYGAVIGDAPGNFSAALTNETLFLETEINGVALAPREAVSSVAYALIASTVTNGAITALQLANSAVTETKLAPSSVNGTSLQIDSISASKIQTAAVDASKIKDGSITASEVGTNVFWRMDGNDGLSTGHFLGTRDDSPLQLRFHNYQVMKADTPFDVAGASITLGSSNVIGYTAGAVISGGFLNQIGDSCYRSVIGGGYMNTIQSGAQASRIGGGSDNVIESNGFVNVMGGGLNNRVKHDARAAVLGGGEDNVVYANHAVIAGGQTNLVSSGALHGAIVGGFGNQLQGGGEGSFIGGGSFNTLYPMQSVICGGRSNSINAPYSFIGGGLRNFSQGNYATIAGGWLNYADLYSSVGGGLDNSAAPAAAIAGGISNTAAIYAFIGGGIANEVNERHGVVGGGEHNACAGQYATIGGGRRNQAAFFASVSGGSNNQAQGQGSFIGGGADNYAGGDYAVIAGGITNQIPSLADGGTISGGRNNRLESSSDDATIGGGRYNKANTQYSTISGGTSNIADAVSTSIGGGEQNRSQGFCGAIAGGRKNYVDNQYGSVGGGQGNWVGYGAAAAGGVSNTASGLYSMVPGGLDNTAGGDYSLASGRRAQATHDGSFVWSDSLDADFASTAANQFSIRASNGVRLVGSPDLGSLLVAPNQSSGTRHAQLMLAEEYDGDFGMLLRYDGGSNYLTIAGKQTTTTNGPHLVILRDQSRVGVGRIPATYALEVEGDASKTVAGAWQANSDARIKTDVRTLTNALQTIEQLRPVRFRYTEAHRAQHPSIEDRDYCNYIAQEYRQVFPESVKEDGAGLLSVDTYNTQPYLVRAVQELHAQLQALQTENADLRKRLEALEARTP